MKKIFLFIPVFILIISISCREDDINSDSSFKLSFSSDTVMFDTVFTTIGSVTKQLKIYNKGKDPVIISRIYLAGGENSFFKLNIDGDVSADLSDIELRGEDSLYIFVQVTVDPNGANNPMVVNDSVVFLTNGNTQDVNLVAYGQDVHLINGEWIETTTWYPDKPYLIYNDMGVDSGNILTIEAGTELYFHKGSGLYVLGKLMVNGTRENPVIFRGDRLDDVLTEEPIPYDYLPNQWFGIIFYPISRDNVLNYCVIRNANIGVYMVMALEEQYKPQVTLNNAIIQNNSFAGIYSFDGEILAKNCLIANNGIYTFAGIGGDYRFLHCTFSKYWPHGGGENNPAVILQNFFENGDTMIKRDLNRASFVNCIIDGSGLNQLSVESKPDKTFNYFFDHCLLKIKNDSVDTANVSLFRNVIFNEDPHFKLIPVTDEIPERYLYDYHLDSLSAAKDKGQKDIFTDFPELREDLDGNSRDEDAAPDPGAYELKE